MQVKKFSITFVLEVDEENSILSTLDWAHTEDVRDLIANVFYDVDDVKVKSINVRELP